MESAIQTHKHAHTHFLVCHQHFSRCEGFEPCCTEVCGKSTTTQNWS